MVKLRKSEQGFGAVELLILIAILALVGCVGWYVWRNADSDYPSSSHQYEENFVVPNYVSVYLSKSLNQNQNAAVPVLRLSAHAGSGCNRTSELKITNSQNVAGSIIDIKGYDLKRLIDDESCVIMSIAESTLEIPIDLAWLQQGEKEITFSLAGKENKYKLSYSQNKITLTGITATNVFSRHSGANPAKEPQTIELAL